MPGTPHAAGVAEYAIVGDGRSAALIASAGSIDFLCWPRFDSEACFAALLGDESHGRWHLGPETPTAAPSRRYRPGTAILETDHTAPGGQVRVTDFMPWHEGPRTLIRIVEGLSGTVAMQLALRLRFCFGRIAPWLRTDETGFCAELGPDRITLVSPVPLARTGDDTTAHFTVSQGQRLAFILTHSNAAADPPPAQDATALLHATESAWQDWIGRFTKPCHWPEPVKRSLITLRLLTNQRTGGVIAAATTSLPEKPGGTMNWDYRFCWLRDSTFTLTALLNAGYAEEARRWRDWILRAIGGQVDSMQIAYRLDGARRLDETEAPWLPGFQGARPVRIGNEAAGQTQTDVFGELLDSFDVAAQAGIARTARVTEIEQAVVAHLEGNWDKPGAGIWEGRGEPSQHTYSQAMAWAGIHRFLKAHGGTGDTATRLRALAAHIYETVCTRGFSTTRNHFTKTYACDTLDASSLLLPIVGFLPATDPRMAATIAAVERTLMEDGLVRRKPASADPGEEGAFLACSCWLADCRAMQGRTEDARALLERVIGLANDVGLLSEEYHVPTQRLTGNIPQALSHLGVINTALFLSGPVIQRGGG